MEVLQLLLSGDGKMELRKKIMWKMIINLGQKRKSQEPGLEKYVTNPCVHKFMVYFIELYLKVCISVYFIFEVFYYRFCVSDVHACE